jgi:hypothetical protein
MNFDQIVEITKLTLNRFNIEFVENIIPIFNEYVVIKFLNTELRFYCSVIKKINELFDENKYIALLEKILTICIDNPANQITTFIRIDLYELCIHLWDYNRKSDERHSIKMLD